MTDSLLRILTVVLALAVSAAAQAQQGPMPLMAEPPPMLAAPQSHVAVTKPGEPAPPAPAKPPAPAIPAAPPPAGAASGAIGGGVQKLVRLPLPSGPAKRAIPLGAADLPVAEVVQLPLNKSRPLDLPVEVRDVVVGNPEIADVLVHSPTQVYLMGKAVGDTNLFLLDRNGQVIRRIDVNVQLDLDSLRATLHDLVPGEKVQVSAVNDSIFLAGTVRSEAAATNVRAIARRFVAGDTNLVNLVRVAGEQQVLLKVRVAEVSKSVLKDLGFQFSYGPDQIGEFIFSWATAAPGVQAFSTLNLFQNPTATGGPGPFGTQASPIGATALERNGLIKTLAEPNLTAISGESASMLAGGEFPIPVAVQTGSISIDWKQFGIGLTFVPVVLDANRISLKVATEVSATSNTLAINTGGVSVPSLTVRRAATTVEMPSGGSIMIAGLLQNDIQNQIDGLPGLKELPVLGALFRSSNFQRNETELMVIISAFVVKPADQRNLSMPTDGFVPSSDLDRYLLGRLHQLYRPSEALGESESLPLQGPLGYIVR